MNTPHTHTHSDQYESFGASFRAEPERPRVWLRMRSIEKQSIAKQNKTQERRAEQSRAKQGKVKQLHTHTHTYSNL